MKKRSKKTGSQEPRKSQIYSITVAVATLDIISKQCFGMFTDGEETQEQKIIYAVFTAL